MYKNEALVIFCCILIIIIGYCLYFLYTKINKKCKNTEDFGSRKDSDSKRNKMMTIYKSDEILDPDEDPDDENDDPDSTRGRDPD